MNEELHEKVLKWLTAEGYPFEFEVAELLRSFGFSQSIGVPVQTADGGFREVDVIGGLTETDRIEGGGVLHVIQCTLAIECKHPGTKGPWVVLCDDGPSIGLEVVYLASIDDRTRTACLEFLTSKPTDSGPTLRSLFGPTPNVFGFSVVQSKLKVSDSSHGQTQSAKGANRDVPFEMLSKMAEAADVLRAFDIFSDKTVGSTRIGHSNYVIPVVALNGPLFAAKYSNGDIELEEIGCAKIVRRGPHKSYVYVVTKEAMGAFVASSHKCFQEFVELAKAIAAP